MPDTARALKTLMEPIVPAASSQETTAAKSVTPSPSLVHIVRKGETLFGITSKIYGTHPFKPHTLFGLLVQRNPQSFVRGNPNRLLEGTRLVFPDARELHSLLAAQHPELASAIAKPAVAQAAESASAAGSTQSQLPAAPPATMRKGWVRYP
jgi:Tfp pilus assembly protein FimV